MEGKLVSAVEWRQNQGLWSCSLLYFDDEFNRIPLEPGSHLSFKVLKKRFCIGFARLSSKTYEKFALDSWKELSPCPHGTEVKRGIRCRRCTLSDVTRVCYLCSGEECHAPPETRRVCEERVAYVYLASFGEERIKAGVSQGRRIQKRWIEQGADVARRVLVGNGREVRRFEKRIQDELGALRQVKAEQKINVMKSNLDLGKPVRLLNVLEGKVHEKFPEAHHFHEEPQILSPYYLLHNLDRRPLELKIREGLEVSGQVLGVKGPILLLKAMDLPLAIDLNRLIGRKIDTEDVSLTKVQAGLERYLFTP